jgi:beta-phosphoglucomutase-like phosphatase (HAD superfamily)
VTLGAIRAVLFDLDGTLVDSEPATDRAIDSVMADYGIAHASLPSGATRGRTWGDVVAALREKYAIDVEPSLLEGVLLERWIERAYAAEPIPGGVDAVRAASRAIGRVAIVSSSPRRVIDAFVVALDLAEAVPAEHRIGAEAVVHPKPHPEPYRRAAERLGVPPEACLVFEDSIAGLTSARAAGARTIAILSRSIEADRCRALADRSVADYLSLGSDFFARASSGVLR